MRMLTSLLLAPVMGAFVLAGCSKPPRVVHNAPLTSSEVIESKEPQNVQEKPLDFSVPAPGGGGRWLTAQGDINNLLDQIHQEKTGPGN